MPTNWQKNCSACIRGSTVSTANSLSWTANYTDSRRVLHIFAICSEYRVAVVEVWWSLAALT